eukprot:CAMPEP_0197604906 /NCGR_PEP_ID=MMETSP1326-20131121/42100_1 /TAXON_ID=1155430 /ORGANISM="Genus nov. species nov., Strain RCC2288" /LENGTH=55 /DNA_ID=CAMNT_0043172633 /DNA_START=57 /DNA_END=221 /DNA_ORIENTATION=-
MGDFLDDFAELDTIGAAAVDQLTAAIDQLTAGRRHEEGSDEAVEEEEEPLPPFRV